MNLIKRGTIALLGISTFFYSGTLSASTIRDDVPDSDYLDLGADAAFAAVGLFVNSWGYTGCGVLIAPDWVLTAGHMLDAATGGTFTVGGIDYTSTEIIKNPGWTGVPFNGSDFGLVHLSSSVTAIPPAMLYTGTSEFGQIGTYVGYGFSGTGLTGWSNTTGNEKRAFQNVIDGNFGNPAILLGSDFDNPHTTADNGFGSAIPLPLEGCVTPGDSGGGVFIQDGSQYYLAGVISFVANADASADSDYGDASGFGRVSAYIPWIVSTIPEPSTFALLAGSGLAMLFCRRRKK
ncbi:MAG: trypsin-like serine protease [Limisphaerales bacterium]